MMKKWLRNSDKESDKESDDRKRDDEIVTKRKLQADNKSEAAVPELLSPGRSQDKSLYDDEPKPSTRIAKKNFPNRQTFMNP